MRSIAHNNPFSNISEQAAMMHNALKSVTVLAIALISSCGTSKQETSHAEQVKAAKERMQTEATRPNLAPGSCRMIATIVSIDQMQKSTVPTDPCSKAPCSATVKIDSILAYGSAFPASLVPGQTLHVTFAHTLNATKELLPDLTPALPGLRAKESFEAIISSAVPMGSSEPAYTVYSYEKK